MIGSAKVLMLLSTGLGLIGCADVGESPACVDPETETLYVTVTNSGSSAIVVPDSAPHIGCCDEGSLAIAVTDSNGDELKRCAKADSFGTPSFIHLAPSESKQYAFSELTISTVYCNVELTKRFVTARFTENGRSRRLLPDVSPVLRCPKQ